MSNIFGTDGHDELLGGFGDDFIVGYDGNDTIDGFIGDDFLSGGRGRDEMYGGDDDDFMGGGDDRDTLFGGSGDDFLSGDRDNDRLFGETGLDDLFGGEGDDTLDGGADADYLNGDLGNNSLNGGAGEDNLNGYVGNDTLDGGADADELDGDLGNNSLNGGTGEDELHGYDDNDTLNGGADADRMEGGRGNDTYHVDNSGDVVDEFGGDGTDQVLAGIGYTLSSDVENLTLTGLAAINGTGNGLDNVIRGNSGANVLSGQGGNDTYYAGVGDTVVEAVNGGTDKVYASTSFTIGSNIENLALTGTGNFSATGNGLVNRLTGNTGHNEIDGAGGADKMEGGRGNDTYHVDNLADIVTEDAGFGTGIDMVISTVSHTLAANVEKLTLGGTVKLNGIGNGLGNVLTGNGNVNRLDGGGGKDEILGLGGSDVMSGGSEADQFVFRAPTDGGAKGDTITDFQRGLDRIALDDAGFGLSGTGTLAARGVAFIVGNGATGAGPTVIFKPFADQVWWDADGTGVAAAQFLATVTLPALVNLSASDFVIV